MTRRRTGQRLDWRWIGGCTFVSAVALVVFFVSRRDKTEHIPQAKEKVIVAEVFDDEEAYYNNEADHFLRTMPDDKSVVACRIDDKYHYVCYVEKTALPSCYLYDLETCTTSVLFSGSEGVDTEGGKLTIKTAKSWQTRENNVVFIAENGNEEVDYTNQIIVFVADIENASFALVDYCADAYFTDEEHINVVKAQLKYRSFFTGKDVYTQYSQTYKI